MPSLAFVTGDFKVFDVEGFRPRMAELRSRVRPKLEVLGKSLAPAVSRSLGGEVFAHVAKHARRTVNPPDDTWVAFSPDARGYKKHCHFKVAVSRHAVRFLFEVGPEHADKKRWATAWKKNAPKLAPVLRRVKSLAWFKNEHDEELAARLADLTPEAISELADELLRTRDGQLVIGRAVRAEAMRLAGRKRDHYVRLARHGLPTVRGVTAFLDEVVAAGILCAVATSASRFDVDRLLGRLGLRERFDAVVTAEDVRLGKPDPEVYLLAARGIGVPPRECLVFEDSVVGIQAARRAGMRVIGVATAHTADELRGAGAASVIDDFEGLEWPA